MERPVYNVNGKLRSYSLLSSYAPDLNFFDEGTTSSSGLGRFLGGQTVIPEDLRPFEMSRNLLQKVSASTLPTLLSIREMTRSAFLKVKLSFFRISSNILMMGANDEWKIFAGSLEHKKDDLAM